MLTVGLMISERLQSAETVHVKIKSLKTTLTKKIGRRLIMLFWLSKIVCDAILTARDNVVKARVEMDVRSITDSPGRGPSSVVQNPDRRVFAVNTGDNQLMSTSRGTDVNVDQSKKDKTPNVRNFEDGDYPALRPNYDQRVHTHHTWVHG